MKEITVEELNTLIEEQVDFQLIDVREPYEREIATIHGLNIPLSEIDLRLEEINHKKDVIIYCRSGKRSATAIEQIQNKFKDAKLLNLKGGILEWADKIDSTIVKY